MVDIVYPLIMSNIQLEVFTQQQKHLVYDFANSSLVEI